MKKPNGCRRAELLALESRTLLSVVVAQPMQDLTLGSGSAQVFNLFPAFRDTAADPIVQFNTSDGNFQVQLFPDRAPRTVNNFVHYLSSGLYNNTIFHASVPGVRVEGGGVDASFAHIPTFPRILNEPGVSNALGTIAMAKVSGQPNSATSDFFINTGNNAASLDQQNGGFTAFGQVIGNGMQVVNAINALPTATPAGFSQVPVVQNPPKPQEFVTVQSVTLLPDLTYSVVSDNPALASASVSGTNLTLMSHAAAQGTAHVTVTASDSSGHTASQMFAVNVGTLDVQIGDGAQTHSLSYVDANGITGTVTMLGGTATLHFSGINLASSAPQTDTIGLSGSGIHLASIATTGTTSRSTLAFKGSDGLPVGSITTDATIGEIDAGSVALTGDLTVSGTLSRLDLGSISNGTIDIGGTAGATPETLTIRSASNADVVSDSPIQDLTSGSWTGAGDACIISAPSIAKLTATGDFAAGLDLVQDNAANLGTATIHGALGAAQWRIVGSAGIIAADSVAPGFSATISDSLRAFTVRNGFAGATLRAATMGKIKLGQVNSNNGGASFGLTAHTLASLTARAGRKRISLSRLKVSKAAAKLAAAGLPLGDFTVTIA